MLIIYDVYLACQLDLDASTKSRVNKDNTSEKLEYGSGRVGMGRGTVRLALLLNSPVACDFRSFQLNGAMTTTATDDRYFSQKNRII